MNVRKFVRQPPVRAGGFFILVDKATALIDQIALKPVDNSMTLLHKIQTLLSRKKAFGRATNESGTRQPPPPSMQDIFSDIFRRRAWEGLESVSGPGSGVLRASVFRDQIPLLLKEIGAGSFLDAACGDFNWMKEVKLDSCRYVGVDVVPELISQNRQKYGNAQRSFVCLDITRDRLPRMDVIFCRDCLVHFSYRDIWAAIRNFQKSGSKYLLATTFTGLAHNTDIMTGGWRTLNLQTAPFHFPPPLRLIDEKCSHSGGIYADKHLALWELHSIESPYSKE